MNSQELIKLVSTVLSSEKHGILYRPELSKNTGSVTSAILLQQMVYWWQRSDFGSFYKFKQPCKHKMYRAGDSWCEELGFSRAEFDTAIKHIGIKKTSEMTIQDAAELSAEKNLPVVYWTTRNRVTYYTINAPVLLEILSDTYLPKSEIPALGNAEIKPLVDQESSDRISESTRNYPENGFPKTPTSDDCADLWLQVSAEDDTEEEKPINGVRDYLTDLAQHYERTKGVPSWTVTGPEGADPWANGPVEAFCKLAHMPNAPPGSVGAWARAFEKLAKPWEVGPPEVAAAIELIGKDEKLNWRSFTSPLVPSFQEVLDVTISRVKSGETAQGWSQTY